MKKVLSLFLSVLMLTSIVTAVDLSSYAATTDSGKCGENLVWEYSDGILTISGEGKMYDYDEYYRYKDNDNNTPWFDYKNEIYKVDIEEGITSIGDYAFYYCYSLRDIVIPDGVKSIGEYAFCNTCLRKIVLPETIKKIGDSAFRDCSLLKTVYYAGTEEDWYNIQICQNKDSGSVSYKSNEYLITASIKYNYQAEKNSDAATEEEPEDGSESIVTIAVIVIAVALVLLLMLATAVIVFVLTRRHYKKHN